VWLIYNETLNRVYEEDVINGTVIIPNNVERLNSSAFYGLKNLIEIVIPESVRVIENSCFEACSNLKSVRILNDDCIIEDGVFSSCKSLIEIKLPANMKDISEKTFFGCSALQKIKLPNNIKIIGNRAFDNCTSLVEIEFPPSVTAVAVDAFSDCNKLKRIMCSSNLDLLISEDGYSKITGNSNFTTSLKDWMNIKAHKMFGDHGEKDRSWEKYRGGALRVISELKCGIEGLKEVVIDGELIEVRNYIGTLYVLIKEVDNFESKIKGMKIYLAQNILSIHGNNYYGECGDFYDVEDNLEELESSIREQIKKRFIDNID
jgi:hypothetical protein